MADWNIPWMDLVKIIVPALSGGVMGAVLNRYYTNKQNKIQRITTRLKVSIIDFPESISGFKPTLALPTQSGQPIHFEQLGVVQLEVFNYSNKDFSIFNFGVTLPPESVIVSLNYVRNDRHHLLTCSPNIDIDHPSSTIDFKLKPFNRTDDYMVTLIVKTDDKKLRDKIKLSTDLPVEFIQVEYNRKEVLAALANVGEIIPTPYRNIFMVLYRMMEK